MFPVNYLSKKKRVMRRGMRKPHTLKVGCYTDRLIDLKKYLALFPGAKLPEKIGVAQVNYFMTASLLPFKSLLIFLNRWRLRGLFIKV